MVVVVGAFRRLNSVCCILTRAFYRLCPASNTGIGETKACFFNSSMKRGAAVCGKAAVGNRRRRCQQWLRSQNLPASFPDGKQGISSTPNARSWMRWFNRNCFTTRYEYGDFCLRIPIRAECLGELKMFYILGCHFRSPRRLSIDSWKCVMLTSNDASRVYPQFNHGFVRPSDGGTALIHSSTKRIQLHPCKYSINITIIVAVAEMIRLWIAILTKQSGFEPDRQNGNNIVTKLLFPCE